MGVREGTRKLAIANLTLLYSLFLGLFNNSILQIASLALGLAAFYLQYSGWKELERVKKEYSPGKRSVVETANGIVFSFTLSLLAFISLRAKMLYLALALSFASAVIALYYTVKAMIDYLKALRAVDRDYGTRLFWGGLLAVAGLPIAALSYYTGAYPVAGSLPAALGLSLLALDFWRISQSVAPKGAKESSSGP